MPTSDKHITRCCRTVLGQRLIILCVFSALSCVVQAQQGKSAPAKKSVTGHYEGTAKNKAAEVITVTLELIENDGAVSGTITSSHGNFPITGGTRDGENVTIE